MDLLADFLHFGANVVFVARRFRAVWSVGRKECSVKCEVWRNQWEVRSVKCGVWSVKCEVSVWSAKSAVWSVKCEVWSVKEAVWSVKCGVWSLECEECSVKCGVWSVKTLLRLSLKKSNGCRGKDTVGTGCLWTIGHLCLGNFRRRLARVYVSMKALPMSKVWKTCQILTCISRNKKSIRPAEFPNLSSGFPKLVCFGTGFLRLSGGRSR